MNRIITAAVAALIALPAVAAEHEMPADEQMTMLQQRLSEALSECNIDMEEADTMNLTMAQVSGIVLSSNSDSGSDECQKIEAIARGDM